MCVVIVIVITSFGSNIKIIMLLTFLHYLYLGLGGRSMPCHLIFALHCIVFWRSRWVWSTFWWYNINLERKHLHLVGAGRRIRQAMRRTRLGSALALTGAGFAPWRSTVDGERRQMGVKHATRWEVFGLGLDSTRRKVDSLRLFVTRTGDTYGIAGSFVWAYIIYWSVHSIFMVYYLTCI